MWQVVFRIPLRSLLTWLPGWMPAEIPIYGFGFMMVVALYLCTWLAGRRAEKEGWSREYVWDLAIWLFVFGLLGARVTYILQDTEDPPQSLAGFVSRLPRIWDGGIILYGSVIGGGVGYLLAAASFRYYFRKPNIPTARLADIIAPSMAMGLCLGRLGCFLNGCCYGSVASPDYPAAVAFPLASPARFALVARGVQTPAGFTMNDHFPEDRLIVGAVDPDSAAARAGLLAGDTILRINGKPVEPHRDLRLALHHDGAEPGTVAFTVQRKAGSPTELKPFSIEPRAGFALADCTVDRVDPTSPAGRNGLRAGDVIVGLNGQEVLSYDDLWRYFLKDWPRGQAELVLTVVHDGEPRPVVLSAFRPGTLGLHPTQLYESISMILLFALLTAFYPFRRRPGEVMALLMVCYAVHRYLNELIRDDPRPVGFEQYSSLLLLLAGIGLWVGVYLWPARSPDASSSVPPVPVR